MLPTLITGTVRPVPI